MSSPAAPVDPAAPAAPADPELVDPELAVTALEATACCHEQLVRPSLNIIKLWWRLRVLTPAPPLKNWSSTCPAKGHHRTAERPLQPQAVSQTHPCRSSCDGESLCRSIPRGGPRVSSV